MFLFYMEMILNAWRYMRLVYNHQATTLPRPTQSAARWPFLVGRAGAKPTL